MSFGLRLPSPVIKGPSMSGLSTGFRIRRHTEAQLFRDGSLVSKDKVRLGKVRSGLGQVRLGQVRLGQVRLGLVRLGQVRLGQVRLGQIRIGQVIEGQRSIGRIHTPREDQLFRDGSLVSKDSQFRLGQVGLGQVRLGQVRLDQDRLGYRRLAKNRQGFRIRTPIEDQLFMDGSLVSKDMIGQVWLGQVMLSYVS